MTRTSKLLVEFYDEHGHERDLPWRNQDCPPDLTVLVEGMLLRTRVETAAAFWDRVFEGVETAEDWLKLRNEVKLSRLVPLGLHRQKLRVMNRLALMLTHLHKEGRVDPDFDRRVYYGHYVESITALRLGGPGYPVDTNIRRVGGRFLGRENEDDGLYARIFTRPLVTPHLDEDIDGDPKRVPAQVPAAYKVVVAIMDVAAAFCGSHPPLLCGMCPLAGECFENLSKLDPIDQGGGDG